MSFPNKKHYQSPFLVQNHKRTHDFRMDGFTGAGRGNLQKGAQRGGLGNGSSQWGTGAKPRQREWGAGQWPVEAEAKCEIIVTFLTFSCTKFRI